MDIKRAEKILALQLQWIQAADAKVSPIFAINVAMAGSIVALTKALTAWTAGAVIFTALCLSLIVLSVVFLSLAMFPRLKGPTYSNIFFGGITKRAELLYLQEMKTLTSEKYAEDLITQAYRNAEIAQSKYQHVKRAFITSFLSVPFWLVAIYLLYI